MRNTGYTTKVTDAGYMVEFFAMNSQTFDVQIIDTRGPFDSVEAAAGAESEMRAEEE